jgi:2-aminoadipate transaminase
VANPDPVIRSLLSAAAQGVPGFWRQPGPVVGWNFDSGRPDPTTFPVDDMIRASEHVLRTQTEEALGYGDYYDGTIYGYAGLRDQLAERSRRRDGKGVGSRHVILTSGGVQAISLALKAFLDPGDVLAVEAPTWGAVVIAAQRRGADVVAIPVDDDGLRVELLEERLQALRRQGRRLKLVYCIATFNTPTGVSMSVERRRRLVELAQQWSFLVLEDNVYGDLRYRGDKLPTLFGMDDSGLVFMVDSFSKTMAPALRLGWATGHPEVIAAMAGVRTDLGVSQWMARVMSQYLSANRFDAHVAGVNELYRAKLAAAEDALHRCCEPWVSWRTPEGGFFLWVELDPSIDPDLFHRTALDAGALVRPGERFFGQPDEGRARFRLAFSQLPISAIDPGITVLGKAIAESVRSDAVDRGAT